MNRKLSLIILVLSLFVAAFVVAGATLNGGRQSPDDPASVPYRQMDVYQEVLEHINNDYVTTPNLSTVTDGALHGLLESLDPDSSYLDPTEYKAYLQEQKEPEPANVGLVVTKRFGYAAIIDVRPGSPAAKAGLARGDLMESIAGKSTRDLSLTAIRELLAGQPGTSVEVSAVLLHRVQPEKLRLARVVMPPAPLLTHLYAGDVGYIGVPDLKRGRARQIADAIRELTGQGAKKFIVDLRNCGRGDYDEAEAVANLFIKQGTITYLQGQKFPRETFSADPNKAVTTAPLAVLTNIGTYGPPEIVAAAVLGDHRGAVVGDPTFGEGSVQKVLPLDDGAAVLLSVARYYSPDGTAIQNHGVKPSVEQVEYPGAPPQDDAPLEGVPPNRQDLQLQKALEVLGASQTVAAAAAATAP
ncbi:MAG TPA: S41 family peptidase [Terriglobales bacterium]|nr:S41 family peptidase [Terriglobales bacterium]